MRADVDGTAAFGEGSSSVFALLDSISSDLRAGVDATPRLNEIDSRMSAMLGELSGVGTRYNQITAAQDTQAKSLQDLATRQSGVEDVDLSQTIVELQMQEVAYQGALGATARVLQPTLMDFLRVSTQTTERRIVMAPTRTDQDTPAIAFVEAPLGLMGLRRFWLHPLDDLGFLFSMRSAETDGVRLFVVAPEAYFADYAPTLRPGLPRPAGAGRRRTRAARRGAPGRRPAPADGQPARARGGQPGHRRGAPGGAGHRRVAAARALHRRELTGRTDPALGRSGIVFTSLDALPILRRPPRRCSSNDDDQHGRRLPRAQRRGVGTPAAAGPSGPPPSTPRPTQPTCASLTQVPTQPGRATRTAAALSGPMPSLRGLGVDPRSLAAPRPKVRTTVLRCSTPVLRAAQHLLEQAAPSRPRSPGSSSPTRSSCCACCTWPTSTPMAATPPTRCRRRSRSSSPEALASLVAELLADASPGSMDGLSQILARGLACEALSGDRIGFTAGVLTALADRLGVPSEIVLEVAGVSREVVTAVRAGTGPWGQALRAVIAYERDDAAGLGRTGLSPVDVYDTYLRGATEAMSHRAGHHLALRGRPWCTTA